MFFQCIVFRVCRSVTQFDPPVLTERHLVVDGLFGSGLNKPLNGGFAAVVKYINASKAQVVAIDVPSGLMCEDNTYNIRQNMIRADVTLSIQLGASFCMRMTAGPDFTWLCLIGGAAEEEAFQCGTVKGEEGPEVTEACEGWCGNHGE